MKRALAVFCLAAGLAGVLLVSRSGGAFAKSDGAEVSAAGSDALQQQVVAAEREGIEALKRGDVKHFGELTADEAVFVDDHGPADKTRVLQNVAGFTIADYTMEDVKFVEISANTGLISYKIAEKGNSHGHDFSAQVYVSSVWTERGSNWVCLFSQETAVRKPAAPAKQ